MGIPIQSIEAMSDGSQLYFKFLEVPHDILHQADMFHLAKHAIKHTAFQHGFDVTSLPLSEEGTVNNLGLQLMDCDLENLASKAYAH